MDLFQEPGGRSKGCAIVEYETPDEAHAAIRDLHDSDLMGRMMFVREDREEVWIHVWQRPYDARLGSTLFSFFYILVNYTSSCEVLLSGSIRRSFYTLTLLLHKPFCVVAFLFDFV